MQPSILSIGYATKDSFLDIKPKKGVFKDENNQLHLDLAFDDSSLEYNKQAGIYGGIVLSDKIFRSAHLKSFSSVNPQGFANFSPENIKTKFIQRYIVAHQGRSFVLNSSARGLKWEDPFYVPGIVYVDGRGFSADYLAGFENYLEQNKSTKIIFNLNDFEKALAEKLLSRSELVFINLAKPVAVDLDMTSVDSTIESLADFGVNHAVLFDDDKVFVSYTGSLVEAQTDFALNSFYQKAIFRAAYTAEFLDGADLEDNLQIALAIAENSGFNNPVKPLIARQILARSESKYQVEFLRKSLDFTEKLHKAAAELVERPKGIFAADESGGNIHKKFTEAGIEDIEENRRRYREMFFTTPDIENYLSGVILFEETVDQSLKDGRNFVEYLKGRNMLVGVKLDGGLAPFEGFKGETITKGLDVLDEKLARYAEKGIDFAKWRVAFDISAETEEGRKLPTNAAIAANVQILARYAKACQAHGIVPIVEPEVVYDGSHSLDECNLATKRILHALFEELKLFDVDLAGTILKTNMVLSGKQNAHHSSPQEAAEYTAEALRATVPEELAGVVFLSGGQTVHQATDNLQAITNFGPYPWGVTYSYARALQSPALKAWSGKDENLRQAQLVFLERVAANSHALYKN